MRAALLETFGEPLKIVDVADPDCPADGVIVEVAACGICRSDWHGWTGADPDITLPHVPGHEFCGRIVEVGADCSSFKVGERVTAPFIVSCGTCPECTNGDATVCGHQHVIGFSGWGAFAERLAVPHADFNLVRVPDALSDTAAAAMGCRLTTAYRALMDRTHLRSGEWVAVHGCGGVGLSAIMIAKAVGARAIAIDPSGAARAMAEELGAEHLIDPTAEDAAGSVRDLTDGGAHVSLDALGITATFTRSLRSLRPLGRHVQIGQPLGDHATPPLPLLELVYSRQIAILGTRGMAAGRFPGLLDLIANGRIDPELLITDRVPLSAAGARLEAMSGPTAPGIAVIDRFAS